MKKIIVIGVIALFVGVGFQPVFAIETIPNTEKVEKLEDCDCQEVDSLNLIRVKLLMTKLKVVTNIIMSRFEHIPEVKEGSQELLNIIDSNRNWDWPILCAILETIFDGVIDTMNKFRGYIDRYKESDPDLWWGLLIIYLILIEWPFLAPIAVVTLQIARDLECSWLP